MGKDEAPFEERVRRDRGKSNGMTRAHGPGKQGGTRGQGMKAARGRGKGKPEGTLTMSLTGRLEPKTEDEIYAEMQQLLRQHVDTAHQEVREMRDVADQALEMNKRSLHEITHLQKQLHSAKEGHNEADTISTGAYRIAIQATDQVQWEHKTISRHHGRELTYLQDAARMLSTLPDSLWSQGPTDVGRVRSFPAIYSNQTRTKRKAPEPPRVTKFLELQFCLQEENTKRGPKDETLLMRAGLGRRSINISDDADHSEFTRVLLEEYPKLRHLRGGWLLHKAAGAVDKEKLFLYRKVLTQTSQQIKQLRQGLKESMMWPLLESRPDVVPVIFPRHSTAECNAQEVLDTIAIKQGRNG
ncbi:hypothetical protein SRHO_G00146170 [Serrasalmus rhombeus]